MRLHGHERDVDVASRSEPILSVHSIFVKLAAHTHDLCFFCYSVLAVELDSPGHGPATSNGWTSAPGPSFRHPKWLSG